MWLIDHSYHFAHVSRSCTSLLTENSAVVWHASLSSISWLCKINFNFKRYCKVCSNNTTFDNVSCSPRATCWHNYPRRHSRRRGYGVQTRLSVFVYRCLFVCLSVGALKGKRLELSTPNLVHVYCIAVAPHEVTQRSKGQGHMVMVWKLSRCTVASDHGQHPITLYCATCGRCWHGSACRYDCICFLVKIGFSKIKLTEYPVL